MGWNIKLKKKIRLYKTLHDLRESAEERYKYSPNPEPRIRAYMRGVKDLIGIIRENPPKTKL
jgi:hypothetical protein